ncbi:uncharacterized protein LOC131853301 [Achroia grisella]|uniref:uncharacterized protein LOC131853301 n=1 Tax=Achroia grisella TaxID=688607 RepID=UPI0027D280E0|nr:uncharacterized protein LOC131853301 [Achroia grisella]
MGNKRKREKEEARIMKKMRKLEQKLHRRRRILSSDDNVSSEQLTTVPSIPNSIEMSPSQQEIALDMPDLMSPLPQSPNVDPVVTGLNPSPVPDKEEINVYVNTPEEMQLEDDILQILGEAPQPDIKFGKNIHSNIASRWEDILIKGLPKEAKDIILKRYFIPANCSNLMAPILNPEAKVAMPDILVKRDATLVQKQSQIGIVLSALAELTEMILQNENSKQKLLQPLSDACRLLCDSHNVETKTRRNIIMSSINCSLRDTFDTTKRDKFLFGEDLAEKLKAAKSVQKTGESLSQINPVASTSRVSIYKNMSKTRNLNYRGQIQRKPPFRNNETSRGRASTRQPRSNVSLRPPAPPPPRRAFSPTRKNHRR